MCSSCSSPISTWPEIASGRASEESLYTLTTIAVLGVALGLAIYMGVPHGPHDPLAMLGKLALGVIVPSFALLSSAPGVRLLGLVWTASSVGFCMRW